MCGRFAFFSPAEAITAAFGFDAPKVFAPRYNIAPTQDVVTVMRNADGELQWSLLHWGLVPFWARDPSIGNRMINARAETIAEKPAYRTAFSRHRCLVPASGFYEWRKDEDGKKTPYYISRADGLPLVMAGIWDTWEKGDEPLHSFSIVTTDANDFMRDLHHRMPVILERDAMQIWLDGAADKAALQDLVLTPVATELQAWSVSRRVNSPLNDEPGLVEARS